MKSKHIFKSEIAKFTSKERDQYEQSLKYYRDLKNVIDTSFEEGKMEGIIEGKMEGIIEGKLEGIIEGKLEGKLEGIIEEKIEIALKALKKGIDIGMISELTGLSEEEIGQLKTK